MRAQTKAANVTLTTLTALTTLKVLGGDKRNGVSGSGLNRFIQQSVVEAIVGRAGKQLMCIT